MQQSTPITPQSPEIIKLGESTTEAAIALLAQHGIYPDELQQTMLVTHIKAMAWRSHSGESLPELELDMFDEISPICLTLAEQVCGWMDNLAYEEAHLLSVHFEVAKDNELSNLQGE